MHMIAYFIKGETCYQSMSASPEGGPYSAQQQHFVSMFHVVPGAHLLLVGCYHSAQAMQLAATVLVLLMLGRSVSLLSM